MDKSLDSKRCAVIHEDIYAKGYGIIPQSAMFDVTIPVKSKALYAYFCSFSGAGHYVFPSRDRILEDLNMSKGAYYNALNPLLDAGYLKIEKARGYKNKNVFILSNKPNTVKTEPTIPEDKEISTLSIEGINANGFGMIPKSLMCDDTLTLTAKALLAFFYSLAASGVCVFPQRTLILNSLNISKQTYYSALNLAIERGYVIVHIRRSKNGRFAINNYVLAQNPSPCPKNEDIIKNEENTEVSPCPKNEDIIENRVLKNGTYPCPKNEDDNSIIFNSNSTISTSNLKVSTTTKHVNQIQDWIYKMTEYDRYKKKIIPELLKNDNPRIRQLGNSCKLSLKVVQVIQKMATSDKALVVNGTKIDKEKFISSLEDCVVENSLRPLIEEITDHFEIALRMYNIKNPNEYLKPMIWQHIENFDYQTDWWKDE